MLDPEAVYDDRADAYHLVHADRRRSVLEVNTALDDILRQELGNRPRRILEVPCGIGTRAIALVSGLARGRLGGSPLLTLAPPPGRMQGNNRDVHWR
jgi:hypothetical protein